MVIPVFILETTSRVTRHVTNALTKLGKHLSGNMTLLMSQD